MAFYQNFTLQGSISTPSRFQSTFSSPISSLRASSSIRDYLHQQAKEEQEAAEQAAFEEQKQAYENAADYVFKNSFVSDPISPQSWDGSNAIAPATGEPVDWFLDVEGDHNADKWKTGDGNDVVYHKGLGQIETGDGDDVIFMTEGQDGYPGYGPDQLAKAGEGDDKLIGGHGKQRAMGGEGNDFIDLGNGADIAEGGSGADEFIIDLQNSGADLIVDFVDIGDKITVLNGGVLAKDGDWFLQKKSVYDGEYAWVNSPYLPQDFYEIRRSDGELAAVFKIGGEVWSSDASYALTASKNEQGIEILNSQIFYGTDNHEFAAMEFV